MRYLACVMSCLVTLGAATASATTVRALSTAEMTAGAEVIAVGRCVSLAPVWEGRVLVTRATIEVLESLKGDVSGTIEVTLPGGFDTTRRVKLAMTYPGAPTMQPGERVFLFLDRDPVDTTALTVSGFSQGKYAIVDEAGRSYVTRDLTNLTLVGDSSQSVRARDRKSLDALRQEVRGLLAR
jgi:hypothetical protein